MNMKLNLISAVLFTLSFTANAQMQGRGPKLSAEQRTCLESQIGKPGEGERPTREAMDAAFAACGIEKPNFQNRGEERRGPEMTEEQRTCLESKIGRPGDANRPTFEAMNTAFAECGIERRGPPQGRQPGFEGRQSNNSDSTGVR